MSPLIPEYHHPRARRNKGMRFGNFPSHPRLVSFTSHEHACTRIALVPWFAPPATPSTRAQPRAVAVARGTGRRLRRAGNACAPRTAALAAGGARAHGGCAARRGYLVRQPDLAGERRQAPGGEAGGGVRAAAEAQGSGTAAAAATEAA